MRVVLSGALLAPFAVLAQTQTADAAANTAALDPILVTATRSAVATSQVSVSATVIDRDQIERMQANDVADLLRGIVGIDIARSGGPGAPASVFIRGAESNHTLFLVDGVRYTSETFLNAAIQNLAPEAIERIEIVKGPRAALWGSDAIGGVVNIITRQAAAGLHADASLRAGSFGTRDAAARLAYGTQRGSVDASVQYQDFTGYPPLQSGTEDRGHDALNVNLDGKLNLAETTQLDLRHLQATGTNEYVDFLGAPRSQDFSNRVTAVELDHAHGAWRSELIASLAHDELQQLQTSDETRPDARDYTEVTRRTLEWTHHYQLSHASVLAGAMTSDSQIDSVFHSSFGDSPTKDRTHRNALFAQADGRRGRYDALFGVRLTDHDQFGQFVTGNVELGADAWAGGHVGFAAGRGFKEPELTDLFGSFGNPELDPERSRSLEINLRQALGERQVLTLAAFDNRIDDLIAFDLNTFTLENIAHTRTQGVEAGWRYAGERLDAHLSGNYQDPEDLDTGAQLPRRSRRSLQAGIDYRFQHISVAPEILAYDARVDSNGARMGGYVLANLGASWTLNPQLTLGLRAENLLDTDYETVDGYRTPGRSGYASLRYSLR